MDSPRSHTIFLTALGERKNPVVRQLGVHGKEIGDSPLGGTTIGTVPKFPLHPSHMSDKVSGFFLQSA